jgi:hypothetical protein
VSGEHLRADDGGPLRGGAALPLTWLAATDVRTEPPSHTRFPSSAEPATEPFVGVHDRAAIRQLGDEALPAIEVPPASHADRRRVAARSRRRRIDPCSRSWRVGRRGKCRCNRARQHSGSRRSLQHVLRIGPRDHLDDADLLVVDVRGTTNIDSLAELMLPPAQTRQVAEVVTAMNNLGRVHHLWGTSRAWNESGLSILLCGPPGCGKNTFAEALANRLDLPMYRIDLSQVANKHGETEKNLKRLFDGGRCRRDPLFGEADALFGKRTGSRMRTTATPASR